MASPSSSFNMPRSDSGVDGGKESVDFQAQLVGKFVEIGATIVIDKNFQQARHAARASVRKHQNGAAFGTCLPLQRCAGGKLWMILARKGAIDSDRQAR